MLGEACWGHKEVWARPVGAARLQQLPPISAEETLMWLAQPQPPTRAGFQSQRGRDRAAARLPVHPAHGLAPW